MATSVCLAVVEAEEAMLQVFALQWRAIDLRAKQLRNQCRQVELDEELDREERDLLHEHETLLRMKEKQLTQQHYEDRFKLSTATAAVRKLQLQTEQLHQRRESLLLTYQPSSSSSTTTTTVVPAPAKKPTNKVTKSGKNESATSKASNGASSNSAANALGPAKKATKSVAFSPSTGTHTSRSRRLEDSFNDEDDDSAVVAPVTRAPSKPSAADELMQMLAQDKASDSEGEAPSLADLLFSPDASRPSSPRRAGNSNSSTPTKFTPSKLARSVMKKALAAPLEFDFTRKAALAKAKAEREKQQRAAQSDDDSDDEPADAETPSKKALKRRKDLGISFTDRPTSATTSSKTSGKATSISAATAAARATSAAASSIGSKSLMEKIGAVSLVTAKVPKPMETSAASSATTTHTSSKPSAGAADAAKTKKKKTKKSDAAKEKTRSDASEPESEDFPSLAAANITKRAKPKAKTKSERDTDATGAQAKAKEKSKTKKSSAVEQASSTADMVSYMTQIQDIATPKVAGKKTKKLLFKQTGTTSAFAAKRAEFQQTLADTGVTASSNEQSDDDSDDASGVETPRKAPVMKRKRAQDAPAAPAPAASNAYMQSPSVTALLAMRPSKSPIGIRYVPKTLKSPQITRKRQRTGDEAAAGDTTAAAASSTTSAATAATGPTTRPQRRPVRDTRGATGGGLSASGVGASGLWGNSSASFFDAFVNGGAPRLKRSVVP